MKLKFKRAVLTLLFLLILSPAAFSLEKITVQLNWKFQFEFAGYIAAKEKGFYKNAGLDVTLIPYRGGSVIDAVLKHKADFGVTDSDIFAAMIFNKPVVLLANFFKKSPLVLATKPSIRTPYDLKHKKIMANENEFKYTSIGLLLHKFHITPKDIILVKQTYSIEPFVEGKVDAMAIYITNQPYYLDKLHIDYNIIDPANYGIFAYSGNLFTSRDFLKKKPETVKKFVEATIMGFRYALSHKKEIINIIHKKYSNKPIGALEYEANAVEHIIMPDVFPIGLIDKEVVREIVDEFSDILFGRVKQIDVNKFIYTLNNINLILSPLEREFIKKHRIIKICTNPDWVPIEYLYKGKPEGISISVLRDISKMTGLKFIRVPTKTWEQSQQFLKERKCDLLPSAVKTYKREKYALFTKPYLHYELFIFAKNDKHFVNGIQSLLDKPMARKRGSGLITKLKRIYPNIKIIETDSYKQSFEYVENGKAYYTVATLPVANYIIKKYGYKDIVIIGDTGMSYNLSMAVRKDMPTLVSILNKALSRITTKQLDTMYMRQINLQNLTKFHTLFAKTILFSLSIFLVLFIIMLITVRTNRKLREIKSQLEESIKNFEVLVNSTIQAVIIYKNKVCIEANEVACNMLGYKKDELIGKNILELFTEKSRKVVLEKLKEEETEPYEVEFLKKDGTVVHALAKGAYITINRERVRVGSAVDITEQKKLQEKLKNLNATLERRIKEALEKIREKDIMMMQQSKLASMGELLSMIAHQWRQPLNTIAATINTLLLKVELGNFDREFLKQKLLSIMDYVKHLSETIEDFRSFFRQDKEKNEVSVDEVIESTIKIARDMIEKHNIELIVDLNAKTKVKIFANELKHVILNLINNARDVLVERGIENPYIKIETAESENSITITVKDNGGGIDKALLNKIFEPYFTTKNSSGTGIGLYMSKLIIEGHFKGKIEAKNENGGAMFVITIPKT